MSANKRLNFAGVYTITCIPNGRIYVGQAVNIRKRWSFHQWRLAQGKHDNDHLQNAWNKYGADAFTFAVVVNLEHVSPEDRTARLNEAEIEWLKTVANPFNLIDAGGGNGSPSADTRAKLSADRKARWEDPEYRARVTASMKAKAKDPEFQKRRGAAISQGNSTPAAVAKRSQLSKAMWEDPEHRKAMSKARTANWNDPNYQQRQAASRAAVWSDPEVRAKRIAGMKAAWAKRRAIKT